MLDGLASTDWGTLSHAYGTAADIPALLRAAASGDADSQRTAIDELWSALCHQGTVYDATAPAVPFVARIAVSAEMAPLDRALLVGLLAEIANGSSYVERHAPTFRRMGWELDESTLPDELVAVARAREAAVQHSPAVVRSLAGLNPDLDWRLAELACSTGAPLDASLAGLLDRLASSTENLTLLAAIDLTRKIAAGIVSESDLVVAQVSVNHVPYHDPDFGSRSRAIGRALFDQGFEETGLAWG